MPVKAIDTDQRINVPYRGCTSSGYPHITREHAQNRAKRVRENNKKSNDVELYRSSICRGDLTTANGRYNKQKHEYRKRGHPNPRHAPCLCFPTHVQERSGRQSCISNSVASIGCMPIIDIINRRAQLGAVHSIWLRYSYVFRPAHISHCALPVLHQEGSNEATLSQVNAVVRANRNNIHGNLTTVHLLKCPPNLQGLVRALFTRNEWSVWRCMEYQAQVVLPLKSAPQKCR